MKTSDLAKECDVTIGPMADEGNVVDFFGDKMGFKLINMYQAFLKHYGGTASDDDYEYLQGQQDKFHDLVPNNPRDGEDVYKYIQRASAGMRM